MTFREFQNLCLTDRVYLELCDDRDRLRLSPLPSEREHERPPWLVFLRRCLEVCAEAEEEGLASFLAALKRARNELNTRLMRGKGYLQKSAGY